MIVPRCYPSRVAVCFASGPSLSAEVVATVGRHRNGAAIFGCNDTFKAVPFLDVLYAADGNWIKHNHEAVAAYRGDPQLWTVDKCADDFGWNRIENFGDKRGLSANPVYINTGCNSGYQLINLAYLMGARRIILVGYDLTVRNGQRRFSGPNPWEKPSNRDNPYPKWAVKFDTIEEQLPGLVWNATPGSLITAFPFVDLEFALNAP